MKEAVDAGLKIIKIHRILEFNKNLG